MAYRCLGYSAAITAAILSSISGAASATPFQAVFSGTVVSRDGPANIDTAGFFGDSDSNLTGASYTAKFIYDIGSLGPIISGSSQFASFVRTDSVIWGEVTINGHAIAINGFATPGDVTSAVWNSLLGWMFGKNFATSVGDTEIIGNTFFQAQLVDQVFSNQIPLLSLETPFSSDNANLTLTGDSQSGSLFLAATTDGLTDYEEFFAFLANSVVVSPVTAPVPEPWSVMMMGAGLIGLAALRRRTRAKASGRR